MKRQFHKLGFSLVELSTVLVIIGLIIGGVLVGRDLIEAAEFRSQITQIQKYTTAVETFRVKYNCLPGDCLDAEAFGFVRRGPYGGQGDGNGAIAGWTLDIPNSGTGGAQGQGEPIIFWEDLSKAGMIEGNFSVLWGANVFNNTPSTESSSPALSDFLPRAKIKGNYVTAWSKSRVNYFAISAVYDITGWTLSANPGLSVQTARNIDSKIDDGLPLSGRVTARYLAYNIIPSSACYIYSQGAGVQGVSTTAATAGSATTCYDNGNVGGVTQTYSLNQNGGNGINCALSFQF